MYVDAMPDMTLYFLQASRSIRIAWLLHELNLDYTLKFFGREKERTRPTFKEASGNPLGKAPTLYDGDVMIYESGAICQYLCQEYDSDGRLLGGGSARDKLKVLERVHAAEGVFMIHALAMLYARWFCPKDSMAAVEKGLPGNVQNNLDWLESELGKSESGWLVGAELSLADIMTQFGVDFIFARRLGSKDVDDRRWSKVHAWLQKCRESLSYKKAVGKTGYTLCLETGVDWKQHL